MLNHVVLIGNLTDEPQMKYTQSGTARTRFDIAVNRKYRDREGTLQEEATFVPIIVWGAQGENCANYLNKGRQVAVEGRLRIDSFTPEDAEKPVKVVEVVANSVQFLGGTQTSGESSSTMETQDDGEEVPF